MTKLSSGRYASTVMIVGTYCITNLLVVWTCKQLLYQGDELGKDILLFMIGNFTGTVVGAVVAYHFKRKNGEGGP